MTIRKIITWTLFVFLLITFGGLYAVSGLPRPWAKPTQQAYDRVNYSNLHLLASLIQKCHSEGPYSWDLLKNNSKETVDSVILEEARHEVQREGPLCLFQIHEKPQGDLKIVVTGQARDHTGMVWGITASGDIIKYKPKDDIKRPMGK
jgi:hypothetical protein